MTHQHSGRGTIKALLAYLPQGMAEGDLVDGSLAQLLDQLLRRHADLIAAPCGDGIRLTAALDAG